MLFRSRVGNESEIKAAQVVVRPGVAVSPSAKTAASVTWAWAEVPGAVSYQLFSASGAAISGFLPGGTTWFAQTGLSPDNWYGAYLSVSMPGRTFSTAVSSAVTLAKAPGVPETFAVGQYPSGVIGQQNLYTTASGLSQSALRFPFSSVIDPDGNLRSEERRVGRECAKECIYRWWPYQ